MKNDNGTSPARGSLQYVRLSDVEDPTAAIAKRLGVSLEEASKIVQASGYLKGAAQLLDRIIAGELKRSTRQASVEWRAQLAADLLGQDDPWFDDEEAAS
jgi:hypothetical protein